MRASPPRNRLLASLLTADLGLLRPQLEPDTYFLGQWNRVGPRGSDRAQMRGKSSRRHVRWRDFGAAIKCTDDELRTELRGRRFRVVGVFDHHPPLPLGTSVMRKTYPPSCTAALI